MREIKFRAWDKKKKIMSECLDLDFERKETALKKDRHLREFNEIELMQFTGLKDKNGKEIFEGDVVKKIIKDCQRLVGIFLVKWNDDNVGFDISGTGGHEYEVIGNKFENPKLLNDTPQSKGVMEEKDV